MRTWRLPLTLMLLVGACSGDSSSTCVDPPASEHQDRSAYRLTVDPNPTAPGADVILSVSGVGLPPGSATGAGAAWQCWNGTEWVSTHQLVRGWSGEPATLAVAPGATTTIPAVGLAIPNSYAIRVPDVELGLYRIEDRAFGAGVEHVGYVLVEVRTEE